MRSRREYGNKNGVGRKITLLRAKNHMSQKTLLAQLQVRGIDIRQSSLSHLEGQKRTATDSELRALAEIFNVPMKELFND